MQWQRLAFLSLAVAVTHLLPSPVVASPGDLDPAFGNAGKVLLASPITQANFVLVQRDGRIVVLVSPGTGFGYGIWRLNADGTPDTTFGNGTGHVTPGPIACGCSVAVEQSDGKLLVNVGYNLVRLLTDGSLDPTFGSAGIAPFPGFPDPLNPVGIAVTADGRIVLGGSAYDPISGSMLFAFARFQPNGQPDTTFGGQVTQVQGTATAFAQQPDGRLLLGGRDLVARFEPDGAPEATFGLNGIVRNDSPSAFSVRGIAVQPDGNILLAGGSLLLGVSRMAVVRIDASGNRDPSFGTGGEVTLQVAQGVSTAGTSIALDSRQRIVVAGTAGDLAGSFSGFREAVVVRLNPDGSPDAFFSAHGATAFWDGYSSSGYAVAIQPGDRIVVGSASEGAPRFITCIINNCAFFRTERGAVFRLQGGDRSVAMNISEGQAIEYYYAGFGHYFVTATPAEIAALDTFSTAWVRTGQSFKVWTEDAGGLNPVCRFFSGETFAPKSSHFYTPYPDECAALKAGNVWQFEGDAFDLQLPQGTPGQRNCPAGSAPLYRLYNNGQGGAPNHRYTDSLDIFNQMLAQGWIFEGEAQTQVFACKPAQ